MINKITVFLFCFYIFLISSAQEKAMYFDKNWKETTKKNAEFYRPLPLPKTQNVIFLRDFFIKNNLLQMQGYYVDGIEENYAGEIFWYNKDGNDQSGAIFINKSKQKKLSYFFDDGKLWKTVEYGDSLKNGKTIEYKPDGSILGESIYKNGNLISGISGKLYNFNQNYDRYNTKTKSKESVYLRDYKGEERNFKTIYYWKDNLKTAVEYTYKDNEIIEEKNFDDNGNLIQKIDSSSYFYPEESLKNGKRFYYKTQKSGAFKNPGYYEYRSYLFSDVKLNFISHLVLYRGSLQFLEKHSDKNLYREIDYDFFKENNTQFMRLGLDYDRENAWKPLEKFLDDETQIIAVSEVESLSKENVFNKFSKKTWKNKDLINKPISEELFFVSPDFMGKTLKSSKKSETDNEESALIYLNIAPEKYIILRKNGGYFIPKKNDDIVEIPNFTLN